MNQVIDDILLKINNHDDVKNSVLSKTEKWKNSHYETLSQIINHNLTSKIEVNSELFFTLGNSVSAITLKRLYKKEIKPSAHTDLRFRKTLDKLCVFLDYEDLNDFISRRTFPKEDSPDEQNLLNYLKKVVLELCSIEFEALKDLSITDEKAFNKVLVSNTPYIEKVKAYRQNLFNLKCHFLEDLSNYEVYNYKIISKEDDLIILETEEFWNINFKIPTGIYPYHKRAKQTYYFKYDGEHLKIWDNYNPDIGEVLGL